MNCDLKRDENEPGILKDLAYKLRIYLKTNKRLNTRKMNLACISVTRYQEQKVGEGSLHLRCL